MSVSANTMSAVRSKLNITWDSEVTDERLELVVETVTPALAARLAYDPGHEFTSADGEAWGLFLNACLYEFSDALDDFWENYGASVRACRLLNVAGVNTGIFEAISQTVMQVPGVLDVTDVDYHFDGPGGVRYSVDIEVNENMTMREVNELKQAICMAVYQEHGVDLYVGYVGVYTDDGGDSDA